jgi:hypothetical protein
MMGSKELKDLTIIITDAIRSHGWDMESADILICPENDCVAKPIRTPLKSC